MAKRLTLNTFIEKAKKVHQNKYDYSLVEYVNNYTKVKIICPEHGVFEQTPNNHINKKNKCFLCNHTIGYNRNTFINHAKIIHHNKYNYSLTNYINAKTKVKIICPEHGVFEQTPSSHLTQKTGCSRCSKKYKYTNKEFIENCNFTHQNKYNYSLVKYVNNYTKVKIICPEHGVFEQTPSNHLSGKGCINCKESKNENIIGLFLRRNNIKFIPQHKFDDCKHIRRLPFDFYLPEYNTCIEYNGLQHYKPIEFFGGYYGFLNQIKRDEIKTKYCDDMSIKLIKIKYNDNLSDALLNRLIFS